MQDIAAAIATVADRDCIVITYIKCAMNQPLRFGIIQHFKGLLF
jgi:hypothetical protein